MYIAFWFLTNLNLGGCMKWTVYVKSGCAWVVYRANIRDYSTAQWVARNAPAPAKVERA